MRTQRIVILALLILSGCGKGQYPHDRSVDPLMEEYVQSFEAYLGGPIDYSVQFAETLPGNAVGICYTDANSRAVTILKNYFIGGNHEQKETLIYHELGHCTLDRGHNDQLIQPGNYPASIMNSYAFSISAGQYYSLHRADYLRELFGR